MLKRRPVIHRRRPGGAVADAVLLIAALLGVAYLAYSYGRSTTLVSYIAASDERDRLARERQQLVEELDAQRKRVAILERARQVDEKAYRDVSSYVSGLQDEVFVLKEEVAFYRSIVASGGGRGLQIQSFVVRPSSTNGDYRYQLVLTQDMKSDKVISGTVAMLVAGEQGGRQVQISSDSLRKDGAPRIAFQFKYFQKIEGSFTLPSGFAPQRVLVQAVATGEGGKVAERSFDWPLPVS